MTQKQIDSLKSYGAKYRRDLVYNIMPFWLQYGVDTKNGGIYTSLDRDGTLMDTTKSVWFQGRFGYIAAYAYNHVEPKAEWLAASKSAIDFIEAHCIDTDGHMFFTVTAEGAPIQKRRYVFSECFAAIAMAEYSKASGDRTYARKAFELYLNIKRMLTTKGFLEPKTTIEGRGHSITMILINVVSVIREVWSAPELEAQVESSINDIERYFMRPEFEALLETVGPNGEFFDTCSGRTINPGHSIETSWFILAESKRRGWDEHLKRLGVQIFDWSYKWGWDEQYGGIINFRDCRNFPPQDYSQDMKFWWPQCETIIASLYCFEATGDPKYLDIHKKAGDWAYDHFADKEYGEWYGYLHRDGSVAQPAKGNIFKGPFHVPRMMITASLEIDNICNSNH